MKHPFDRMTEEAKRSTFRVMLRSAASVVFLGGAGVSTESGIPDFRSWDGLYHRTEKRFAKYQPEYLLSYECLRNEPDVFFDYYRTHLDARAVQPNAAHKILAQWEREGRLSGIITQNIDGLHQKAGSVNVQEIHGTTWKNHCTVCSATYGVDFIFDGIGKPKCLRCGGMVRPDVTLYGEFLPKEAHDNARRLIRDADLLIIGGTSLQVGSAAGLARQFSGGHLVIINKSRTLMDGEADLVFHDSIGTVLTAVNEP
ncbi:MAG: NAD-dependent protein deacylase [bacterium]